jgi:hypothetical protein
MFIAILMTGIFPEARAEPVVLRPSTPDQGIEIARAGPVVLRPPASPGGRIEIAQAGSGEPTGDTVGHRDRPAVNTNRPGETIKITTGSAQLLPLEKRAKTVIVGDHNLIEEGVRVQSLIAHRIYLNITNDLSTRRGPADIWGSRGEAFTDFSSA